MKGELSVMHVVEGLNEIARMCDVIGARVRETIAAAPLPRDDDARESMRQRVEGIIGEEALAKLDAAGLTVTSRRALEEAQAALDDRERKSRRILELERSCEALSDRLASIRRSVDEFAGDDE